MKRFLAIFNARNREFLRDRSTLGWNIILPVVLVIGLGFIFSDTNKPMFKVAVVHDAPALQAETDPFLDTRYVQFIAVDDRDLRILPTPLSSIRRSVGVTIPKDRAPSPAAAELLAHLREQGARLAELEREYAQEEPRPLA